MTRNSSSLGFFYFSAVIVIAVLSCHPLHLVIRHIPGLLDSSFHVDTLAAMAVVFRETFVYAVVMDKLLTPICLCHQAV